MRLASRLPPDEVAWLDLNDATWRDTVAFGPRRFNAYARLRFVPDPQWPGQMEHEVQLPPDHRSDAQQLGAVLEVLARHTGTPREIFLCVWDGSGNLGEIPEWKLTSENRSYYTFTGSLRTFFGSMNHVSPHTAEFEAEALPAFVWPADHSWIIANDVDQHWAGIGCTTRAAQALLTLSVDVIPADRDDTFPQYAVGTA